MADLLDEAWSAAVDEYESTGSVEGAGRAAATAAAQIGAAAGCTAVGLAAAAPLCAMVGGEIAGWVMDEVVPFVTDLFSPDPPEPSLIPRADFVPARAIPQSEQILGEALQNTVWSLVGFAQSIGLRGFTMSDAIDTLRAGGLPLVPSHGVLRDPYHGTREVRDPYWLPDITGEWLATPRTTEQSREFLNAMLVQYGVVAQTAAWRNAKVQIIAERAAQRAEDELRRQTRRPPTLREKGAPETLRFEALLAARRKEKKKLPPAVLWTGGAVLVAGAGLAAWKWRPAL